MKSKIGSDGLTSSQRYTLKHPDRRRIISQRSRAKRLAEMTPEEFAEYDAKRKAYWKKYRQEKKEHRRELARKWGRTPAGLALRKRTYAKRKIVEGIPDRNKATIEDHRRWSRESYHRHREKRLLENKARRELPGNKEKAIQRSHEYYQKNKTRVFKTNAAYVKRRCLIDPAFRILCAYRSTIGAVLRGLCKAGKTVTMIGCTPEQFRKWLEDRFEPGMSWENYGREKDCWVVDHCIPLDWWDMKIADNQFRAFCYLNTQPKWYLKNSEKGNRFAEPMATVPIAGTPPADRLEWYLSGAPTIPLDLAPRLVA